MVVFSIILLCAAILFLGVGIAIYKGKISLIMAYHQEHVKEEDKSSYGKAFSIGLFMLSLTFVIAGVFVLFEEVTALIVAGMIIFAVGIIASIIVIIIVQRKYNGGIFS